MATAGEGGATCGSPGRRRPRRRSSGAAPCRVEPGLETVQDGEDLIHARIHLAVLVLFDEIGGDGSGHHAEQRDTRDHETTATVRPAKVTGYWSP